MEFYTITFQKRTEIVVTSLTQAEQYNNVTLNIKM